MVALCVGGMVLSRAIDDPVLAEDLRMPLESTRSPLRAGGIGRTCEARGGAPMSNTRSPLDPPGRNHVYLKQAALEVRRCAM